jgi:hydrogenase expression/formation protein HypC
MCLAVPAKITRLDESGHGIASYLGSEVAANFSLVPQAKPGDWVIIHAGFAISVMDEKEARETLRLFRDMAAADRR